LDGGALNVILVNQYYAPDEAATAQMLADLGGWLASAGHRVAAICSDRSYADPARRYPRRESIDGVDVHRVRTSAFGRRSRLGRALDYLTFLLGASLRLLFFRFRPLLTPNSSLSTPNSSPLTPNSSGHPDLIVSLSTPPMVAALGAAVARWRGARSVFWVMDVYPDLAFALGALRPESAAGRFFTWLSRRSLSASDRVVALGECMAERLKKNGAERIEVVHNWADENAIRPAPVSGNRLRTQWEWNGRFVVLYSGNLGLAHEFETALGAAELLRDRADVLFAFVGGGPRLEETRRVARDRGLPNVEFRPYVARDLLGESLTAGDVHLVTLREAMPGLLVPSKIYGILAAGRPTLYVGPDRGEIFEILAQGECGLRVANGDAAGLAEAVRGYADEPERCREQGRRARELFERRFTKRECLARFMGILEEGAGRA
jgi:glycosyltransferase involved in cell wall biosynthesis